MADDIEERERRITHLAFNDVSPACPTARCSTSTSTLCCVRRRRRAVIALLCLDLDDFKSINDTLGHPVGDELLVATAERLTITAMGHFVARLGGDDSSSSDRSATTARDRPAGPAAARRRVAAADDRRQQLVAVDQHRHRHRARTTATTRALLKNADLALYRAKELAAAPSPSSRKPQRTRAGRRQLETDLRVALEHGQFELYFQPLFDLETNRIGSFEALMRWNHPTRGLVAPVDFIPVAEETGLIVAIGAWALREACGRRRAGPRISGSRSTSPRSSSAGRG